MRYSRHYTIVIDVSATLNIIGGAIISWGPLVIQTKHCPPRPGIEPGPSTWQAEILTTRLSRNCCQCNVKKFVHSFEPDLNQRPMDIWLKNNYSPPLYQLSYRRMDRKRVKLMWYQWNLKFTQSVGFEPTLPEGNWFLVSRLNHSATTAHMCKLFKVVDMIILLR